MKPSYSNLVYWVPSPLVIATLTELVSWEFDSQDIHAGPIVYSWLDGTLLLEGPKTSLRLPRSPVRLWLVWGTLPPVVALDWVRCYQAQVLQRLREGSRP